MKQPRAHTKLLVSTTPQSMWDTQAPFCSKSVNKKLKLKKNQVLHVFLSARIDENNEKLRLKHQIIRPKTKLWTFRREMITTRPWNLVSEALGQSSINPLKTGLLLNNIVTCGGEGVACDLQDGHSIGWLHLLTLIHSQIWTISNTALSLCYALCSSSLHTHTH